MLVNLSGKISLKRPKDCSALEGVKRPLYFASYAPNTPPEVASFLYRSACNDKATPQQQFGIWEIFYRGQFLPVDWPKAVECYLRAAKAGNADAINRLGELWAAGVDGGIAVSTTVSSLLADLPFAPAAPACRAIAPSDGGSLWRRRVHFAFVGDLEKS